MKRKVDLWKPVRSLLPLIGQKIKVTKMVREIIRSGWIRFGESLDVPMREW